MRRERERECGEDRPCGHSCEILESDFDLQGSNISIGN
jgi:hypothetical protein